MSQSGVNSVKGSPGVVDFIQGNTGGPVPPNADDVIFIVGSGGLTVSGNALLNTLTITPPALPTFTWNLVAIDTTLASNNGYFAVGGDAISLMLPPTSSTGDIISIALAGAASFTIIQGAGQSIQLGNLITTAGIGGSLSSTQQGDFITLICMTNNLKWFVASSVGNFTII